MATDSPAGVRDLDLGTVEKPYQYVGFEANARHKPFEQARARLALAFPDAYVIGAVNLGIQILYHVVNEHPDFMADRVYMPLPDMAALMSRHGRRLPARECDRPLTDFDVIGFSLQYELCYTNVLAMLDLAGIPRRARDRRDGDPIVAAGGPCAFNPEPLADFIDVFIIGEGEDVVLEVMTAVAAGKAAGLDREAMIRSLAAIGGVYVPGLYDAHYDEAGDFAGLSPRAGAPERILRRMIADFDRAPVPTRPVVPAIQPAHERIPVEIQRGCTRSCRFCQAGYLYRPRRERRAETLIDAIGTSIATTGIMDVGLLSLSSADYGPLQPLISGLMERHRAGHLALSLPSTRLEALREEYLPLLKEERRSGFTIAPEAGSQRLRNVINKNYTEEEVVETARMLFRNGWPHIKMYFMVGLPTETDEDVTAIAGLADLVARRVTDLPGPKQITVSISNFVPKPHTPFQWHGQISAAEFARRHALVQSSVRCRRQVRVKCHDPGSSWVDGLVARGDRRASRLIEAAYEHGATFDSWADRLRLDAWESACETLRRETGLDVAARAMAARDPAKPLPWQHISTGLLPRFFRNEYMKAVYGVATEDCSFASCHACGLCTRKNGVKPVLQPHDAPPPPPQAAAAGQPVTYRFQYSKTAEGRYLTTLDLTTLLARTFARAGLPLCYDAGMHSRPRLQMGPALPIGVASACEFFDATLDCHLDSDTLCARLNLGLPSHIRVLAAVGLEPGAPTIASTIRAVSYAVALGDLSAAAGVPVPEIVTRAQALLAAPSIQVQRAQKSRQGATTTSWIDLKPLLQAIHTDSDRLTFTVATPSGQSVSPYLMVDALLRVEGPSGVARRMTVEKTGVFTAAPGATDIC